MTTLTARSRLVSSGIGRRHGMRHAWHYLAAAVAIFIAALMLAPIVLSFFASIKTSADAAASPPTYLPHALSIENYLKIYNYQAGLWTYLWNSISVAFMAIVMVVALTVPAGYGLARFRFPGKEALFLVLLIPIYMMFAKMGLANTTLGLAIIHAMLQVPFSVFLMRNAFASIPKELEEAAVIDGCTWFQIFLRVAMPLVLPAVVTIMLFAFINSWNELLAALIVMNKETSFTVPVLVTSVRTGQQSSVDWRALQAGVIVSMVPCVAIYVFLQKYYVSGLLSGAVK